MNRLIWPLVAAFTLAGCNSNYAIIDDENPDDENPDDTADYSEYDGATLRILSPKSGAFLPLGESANFEAELLSAEGEALPFEDVAWNSNADGAWLQTGVTFQDDSLDVGLHDLTAQVELPNGDRLAYTVGGVLVQSKYAGTWAGTFTSDILYQDYTITCAGAALIIVDPYGNAVGGDADCLASLMGYDVTLAYVFDIDNQDGNLSGIASADIFGWFQYDFDATGQIDLETETLHLEFGGAVFDGLAVNGSLGADRVSRDTAFE